MCVNNVLKRLSKQIKPIYFAPSCFARHDKPAERDSVTARLRVNEMGVPPSLQLRFEGGAHRQLPSGLNSHPITFLLKPDRKRLVIGRIPYLIELQFSMVITRNTHTFRGHKNNFYGVKL